MLQFILGNSGAGKSHYLYEKIIQESMKHPEINYLVIVPEQFTMQTQQDLCILHPNHGIMNIDVLSFGRMAHRIFEEVGQSRGQVLDDEGKNLILRKIAGQTKHLLSINNVWYVQPPLPCPNAQGPYRPQAAAAPPHHGAGSFLCKLPQVQHS